MTWTGKFWLTAIVMMYSALPAAALAQEESEKDIYYYYNAFTAAYQQHDYPAYLENLQGASKLRPKHPGIMFALAGAQALNGHSDDALAVLEALGAAGLSYPAANDSDFVSIWNEDRFKKTLTTFDTNLEPVGRSEQVFSLESKGLIAESVAYYPEMEAFFVSSVRERKILAVTEDAPAFDFSSPNDSLWGVFGMKTDIERGLLWVCTGAVPQMEGYADGPESATGLAAYDLKTGQLSRRYVLESEGAHILGDLVIAANGDVLTTDSYAPKIYRLPQGGSELELFVELETFVSPQGLDLTPDGKKLFVADYLNGICVIDMETKEQKLLSHSKDVVIYGIDGLYYHEGSLIAVQNGVQPNRIIRYYLNDALDGIERAEVLEANNPDFAEPTLGMIRGDEFYYMGSSQWGAVDGKGNLRPEQQLKPHIVFKTKLN
jgi:hypothetical protein